MIKTFCDLCKKELTRNVVEDRLAVEQGGFKAIVLIEKDGTANDGDLCLDCLLKMLNQKPKRRYVRKQSAEQVVQAVIDKVTKKSRKRVEKPKELEQDATTDNVTINVPPPGIDTPYVVNIGGKEATE